jgi:hypothetical protein
VLMNVGVAFMNCVACVDVCNTLMCLRVDVFEVLTTC